MTVIREMNKSTLKKKFEKAVTVCKDSGLKANLDKCVVMKICQKKVGMEKIKCNNREIKEAESWK
jgi:hypothetical protein